jgi:hypothetical protein
MTTPVRMILDALAHADPDAPLWRYKLAELIGLGSGAIYPWRFHLAREHQRLYPGTPEGQYTLGV